MYKYAAIVTKKTLNSKVALFSCINITYILLPCAQHCYELEKIM